MNREILFRGKRKDTGEWVEGSLLLIENRSFIVPTKTKMCFIHHKEHFHWDDLIEVIPETVGQFTGLLDTKGKKVWEGSILKDPQGNKGIVFYHTKSVQFLVNWLRKDDTWETDSCIGYGIVVGNKWDNPELLEKNYSSKTNNRFSDLLLRELRLTGGGGSNCFG